MEKKESLVCPRCGCMMSGVKETRRLYPPGAHIVVRIRECRYCKKQFRTKEVTDMKIEMPTNNRNKPKTKPIEPDKVPKDLMVEKIPSELTIPEDPIEDPPPTTTEDKTNTQEQNPNDTINPFLQIPKDSTNP